MIKNCLSTALMLLAFGFVALAASPARADRCDDLAGQLKNSIDGIAVGKTAANVIYLSHPQAKELSLGCSGRSYSNQLSSPKASVPIAAAGIFKPRRQRRRHHFYAPQGRHAEGCDPLYQADGSAARRRRHHALPPPRHALRPHQDRGLDLGLAQQVDE